MVFGPAYLDSATNTISFASSGGGGIAIGSNSGITWGTNGHPLHGGSPYVPTTTPFATQFAMINALGMKRYRVDYDSTDGTHITSLTNLLAAAVGTGVTVDPLLNPAPLSGSYPDEASAYTFGRAFSLLYAQTFPTVQVWECGNEYETSIWTSGEGSFISNYDPAGYLKIRGLVRGLFDGVRAGNPVAKVAFGSSGFGFFGVTDQLWADGVRWDITIEHFYSNGGTQDITALPFAIGTTDKLALLRDHYGKPIWLNEWNYFNPTDTIPNKTTMGNYLTTTMAQYNGFAKNYDLEGVDIYELMDEPQIGTGREAGYGLTTSGTNNAAGTLVGAYLAAHPSVVYASVPNTPSPSTPFLQPPPLGTAAGTADSMTLTPIPALQSLVIGVIYTVQAPNSANSTTTPHINITGQVGSFGNLLIVKRVSTALAANDILANKYCMLLWNGTNMVLLNPTVN